MWLLELFLKRTAKVKQSFLRTEKGIKEKNNKLYVEWKVYDSDIY